MSIVEKTAPATNGKGRRGYQSFRIRDFLSDGSEDLVEGPGVTLDDAIRTATRMLREPTDSGGREPHDPPQRLILDATEEPVALVAIHHPSEAVEVHRFAPPKDRDDLYQRIDLEKIEEIITHDPKPGRPRPPLKTYHLNQSGRFVSLHQGFGLTVADVVAYEAQFFVDRDADGGKGSYHEAGINFAIYEADRLCAVLMTNGDPAGTYQVTRFDPPDATPPAVDSETATPWLKTLGQCWREMVEDAQSAPAADKGEDNPAVRATDDPHSTTAYLDVISHKPKPGKHRIFKMVEEGALSWMHEGRGLTVDDVLASDGAFHPYADPKEHARNDMWARDFVIYEGELVRAVVRWNEQGERHVIRFDRAAANPSPLDAAAERYVEALRLKIATVDAAAERYVEALRLKIATVAVCCAAEESDALYDEAAARARNATIQAHQQVLQATEREVATLVLASLGNPSPFDRDDQSTWHVGVETDRHAIMLTAYAEDGTYEPDNFVVSVIPRGTLLRLTAIGGAR